MPWIKIDDQFTDHPKVLEVGPLAECLFVRGLTYASRYLTDGFVPIAHLRRMGDLDAIEQAGKLVDAGLWHDVEGGYQIHDYLEYQPSAEKVRSERDAAKQRMQRARSNKQQPNINVRSGEVRANTGRSSGNPEPVPEPEPVPDVVGDTPTPPARGDDQPPSPNLRFDAFWSTYPKKVGKGEARKSFARLKPDAALFAEMMAALARQKASEQWQREGGRFVPNPATWINQQRWGDELPPPAPVPIRRDRQPPNIRTHAHDAEIDYFEGYAPKAR